MYENIVGVIKKNRDLRLNNKLISIPWSLPRLSKVLPGIVQGTYVILTANSKVGKSQLSDFLYLYQPLEYLMNHPKQDVKLKIFYFSLEMSKEAKLLAAMSYILHARYNKIISPQDLKSLFADRTLDEKMLELIETDEVQHFFKVFEEHVEIIDSIRNPYGIYNVVKTYAEQNGHYEYKTVDWINDSGKVEKREIIDKYVPNNPDEFVIVITDHCSLLNPEKGMSLHQTMSNFSSNYCLKLRDRFNYTIVNIQQQGADSEKQQFTSGGRSIIEKLKPSPDSLGDCKLTARDANLMLGLFAPSRYGIPEYAGWDMGLMGNHHRELSILLNRDGLSNAHIQLFFNGCCNFFKELPNANNLTDEEKDRTYKYISNIKIL